MYLLYDSCYCFNNIAINVHIIITVLISKSRSFSLDQLVECLPLLYESVTFPSGKINIAYILCAHMIISPRRPNLAKSLN